MRKIKRATLGVVLLLVAGVVVWLSSRSAPISVEGEECAFAKEQLADFVMEFSVDEAEARASYLGRVIEVKGLVEEVQRAGCVITLRGVEGSGVRCNFHAEYILPEDVRPGAEVVIMGRLTGFDFDVQLSECHLVSFGFNL